MDSCIFCKIVDRAIPAKIVFENDHVLAFHDIDPKAPTHILLIPKVHISSILGFNATHNALLGQMVSAIQDITEQENVSESGFRIVTNTGQNGGQTVDHVHFHILGGRSLTWPPG